MNLFKKIKTPVIHVTAWAGYLFLTTWLLSDFNSLPEALLRSAIIIVIQGMVFYFNYFLLLPKLFERRKYSLFLMSIAGVIAFALVIFFSVNKVLFVHERHPVEGQKAPRQAMESRARNLEYRPEKEAMRNSAMIQRTIMFNGFQILFIVFVSTIIRNLEVSRRRDREALQLKNQVLEAESKMLKWQINPHFLFNTLNNIYSMAQLKLDQTPEAIHRLSNMLRYVIYDCNEKYVLLEQEVNYLKSYIELQRLKDDNLRNISYDFIISGPGMKIAPLILIVFLENSFKHSKIEDQENSWIRISLVTRAGEILFSCENSIPGNELKKDKTTGIGLENVKRRLELLYPDKHLLLIDKKEKTFSVTLTIKSDEY